MSQSSFWRAAALSSLLLGSSATWAGDGHDHGEAAPAPAAAALPRFAAVSDDFELVGVLNGQRLTLYLDHAADNRPVTDGELTLDDVPALVPVAARFEPSGAAAYVDGYAEYRKLAGTLKGLYHRLHG